MRPCLPAAAGPAALQANLAVWRDSGGKWERADAAVNCGNCLTELASVSQETDKHVGYICDALACFDGALAIEVDADVRFCNCADARADDIRYHTLGSQVQFHSKRHTLTSFTILSSCKECVAAELE